MASALSLKHNRFWLVLTLVLAMVVVALGPGYAPACAAGVLGASIESGTTSGSCTMTGTRSPCCCSTPEKTLADGAGYSLGATHCGCTVQAPPVVPPAELKGALPPLSLDSTPALSPVSFNLTLDFQSQRPLLASSAPPRLFSAETPSRAPPAC